MVNLSRAGNFIEIIVPLDLFFQNEKSKKHKISNWTPKKHESNLKSEVLRLEITKLYASQNIGKMRIDLII